MLCPWNPGMKFNVAILENQSFQKHVHNFFLVCQVYIFFKSWKFHCNFKIQIKWTMECDSSLPFCFHPFINQMFHFIWFCYTMSCLCGWICILKYLRNEAVNTYSEIDRVSVPISIRHTFTITEIIFNSG